MALLPEMPPELQAQLPEAFWGWWQAFRAYLLTEDTALVMKSPDGSRWQISISDGGAVVVTAL